MKTVKETKIHFFTLIKREWNTSEQKERLEEPFFEAKDTLEYVSKLSKKKRFYELKNDKFCFLDTFEVKNNYCTGIFKSARNEFRPNLINKLTGGERKNPKEKTEGDIDKTHFIIRFDNENKEVYLFLEQNSTGITVLNVVNYLNKFSKEFAAKNSLTSKFTIAHQTIARNSFLTELEKFERAKIAEIYVDKQILGDSFLDFSNRTFTIKQDVLLQVKAERSEDIKNFAIDTYNKFTGNTDKSINKIRIYGEDENGNNTFIDTTFMGQVDFVSAKLDLDTGEILSQDLLTSLMKIAKSF